MKSNKDMLSARQRQQRILEFLAQRGSVRVQPLAARMHVAPMTIRRDLAVLAQQGFVERTHGGATARRRVAYEFSFQEKATRRLEQKRRIGAACAKLVEQDQMVFLDTGTTSLEIARALLAKRPAAIITANLCVVSEYLYQQEVKVLVPGGELNPLSPDLYGDWTYSMLDKVHADIAFLGGDAVDPTSGIYMPDLKSSSISRLIVQRSERCFLAADSSKFGRRARYRGAQLKDLTGIVTDRELPAPTRRILRSKGVKVIVA